MNGIKDRALTEPPPKTTQYPLDIPAINFAGTIPAITLADLSGSGNGNGKGVVVTVFPAGTS
jgi:hypothetical protein